MDSADDVLQKFNQTLCSQTLRDAMRTYMLLNAYKILVNENAAGRNIAKYFLQRNVDISEGILIAELQSEISTIISKLGKHGQTRLMYVCQTITHQPVNDFSKHNIWATCALTGKSSNSVIALRIEQQSSVAAETENASFQCISPLRHKHNANSFHNCNSIYIDASFETFVNALWIVTHIKQIENQRVVDLAEDCLQNLMHTDKDSKSTNNLSNFYDWLFDNNVLVQTSVIDQYISAFVIVLHMLHETLDEMDRRVIVEVMRCPGYHSTNCAKTVENKS